MTDLAMNNGYRLESMQSSGMEQVVMHNFTPATPVPEPETDARMLAGLAALGLLARRRA